MQIDWTTIIVAVITGLLGSSAISATIIAIWRGSEARSKSRRDDDKAHVEAADAISETSVEILEKTVNQYESRLAKGDERLNTLEEKCRRYEMAFDVMHGELMQAQKTIAQHELTIALHRRENGKLRSRVKHLEELKGRKGAHHARRSTSQNVASARAARGARGATHRRRRGVGEAGRPGRRTGRAGE